MRTPPPAPALWQRSAYTNVAPALSATLAGGVPSVLEGRGQPVGHLHLHGHELQPASTDPVTISTISDASGDLTAAFLAANGNSATIARATVTFSLALTVPPGNAGATCTNTLNVSGADDENTAPAPALRQRSATPTSRRLRKSSASARRASKAPQSRLPDGCRFGTTDPITYTWAVYKNGNGASYAGYSGINHTVFAFTPDSYGSYQIVETVTDDESTGTTTSQTITASTPH